jgi:DNA replication protein DnaC
VGKLCSKTENLILYGTVGAGKTRLAVAMGAAACDAGFRTRSRRTPALVNALAKAKKEVPCHIL